MLRVAWLGNIFLLTAARCFAFCFGFSVVKIYCYAWFLSVYSGKDQLSASLCMMQVHVYLLRNCTHSIAHARVIRFLSFCSWPFSPMHILSRASCWVGEVGFHYFPLTNRRRCLWCHFCLYKIPWLCCWWMARSRFGWAKFWRTPGHC